MPAKHSFASAAEIDAALAFHMTDQWLGELRNVQTFWTSTRVAMSGNSGNSYTVNPWNLASYVKQSATSKLLIWATFPTFTPAQQVARKAL